MQNARVEVQTSDHEEFDEQLATLCAGFNVPTTNHRKHAYWIGLAKMSLVQFVRCVEFSVSESGPEDLPTPKDLWRIHRTFRKSPLMVAATPPEEKDHLLFFANRLYFRHLMNRGGVGSHGQASPELIAGRKVVRDLVNWFSKPICERGEDATPEAFIEAMIADLEKVAFMDSRTVRGWREVAAHADAKKPFEPHMGRPLPEYETREVC